MRWFLSLTVGFAFLVGPGQIAAQDDQSGKKNPDEQKKQPEIRKASDDDLLKALKSHDADERQVAQQEIIRRVNSLRKKLVELVSDELQPQGSRVAAIGALNSMWNADVAKAIQKRLDDSDPKMRKLAAESLAANAPKGDHESHEALVQHLFDSDKMVRRAVYLAIGKIGAPSAADALGNALIYDNGKDAGLRSDLIRAIEMLGSKGVTKLLALADSGEMDQLRRAFEAFLALRTRPGVEALPQILKNYHLKTEEKAKLIESFRNYQLKPPPSPDPLAKSVKFILDKEKNVDDAAILQCALVKALKSASIPEKGPTTELLIEILRSQEASIRLKIIEFMGNTAAGAKIVAMQFLQKKLPESMRGRVVEILRRYAKDSDEHRELLKQVMK